MDPIDFLTFDDIVELHREQLAVYGGADGFIDENVVRSAVAMPQSTMFGEYLHSDIAEMAAAYLFHFAAAQGFVDGNKRTAVVATVEFLGRNGYVLDCTDMEVYDVTMGVANHSVDKAGAADWIRDHLAPAP